MRRSPTLPIWSLAFMLIRNPTFASLIVVFPFQVSSSLFLFRVTNTTTTADDILHHAIHNV